jgi:hypothetical protein
MRVAVPHVEAASGCKVRNDTDFCLRGCYRVSTTAISGRPGRALRSTGTSENPGKWDEFEGRKDGRRKR